MTEVITKKQMWKDMFGNTVEKDAELRRTYDMPGTFETRKKSPKGEKAVIPKTASAEAVSDDDVLEDAFGLGGMAVKEASMQDLLSDGGSRALQPHVDVSDKNPVSVMQEKIAQCYACPSIQRYPLDGYDQVEKAAAYFEEYGHRMEPALRREYCANLVKRASALDIEVGADVERYGSETYAPPHQIKIALDARRMLLQDETDIAVLNKLAEAQPMMDPDLFAATLEEFDQRNLLDHHYGDIPDPYFSTFGKQAAKAQPTESSVPSDEAILIGNEYLPKQELVAFSKRNQSDVESRFGKEMAEEFAADPMGIFNSLPHDQKLVLMRMASGGTQTSQAYGASTS